jgi:hypothetical protein
MFDEIPAKNTVYTPYIYIYMVVANPTLATREGYVTLVHKRETTQAARPLPQDHSPH